jgi:hypothetical protein
VWCSVAIPNDLAGRLIGFYLETDHAVLGHFDADLFVEDLVQFRSEFCSSLLVNSLLLWACVSSSHVLPLLHIADHMNSMDTLHSTSVLYHLRMNCSGRRHVCGRSSVASILS